MIIVMTGCASGFGLHVRKKLNQQGHVVFGVGLHGPEFITSFANSNDALTDIAGNVMRRCLEEYGQVDCLINNAGWTHCDFAPQHLLSDFDRVMRVNCYAPFALTQAFIQANIWTEWKGVPLKRVVSTGSMSIKLALRGAYGYVASKAALHGLTRNFAKECTSKFPCTFLTVSPGGVQHTAMTDQIIEDLMQQRGLDQKEAEAYFASGSPLKRLATHDEVWSAFDYAVNHSTAYASGSNVELPGASGQF